MLLDTHTLVWFDSDDRRLRSYARRQIQQAFRARQAAVSPITFLEVPCTFGKAA